MGVVEEAMKELKVVVIVMVLGLMEGAITEGFRLPYKVFIFTPCIVGRRTIPSGL